MMQELGKTLTVVFFIGATNFATAFFSTKNTMTGIPIAPSPTFLYPRSESPTKFRLASTASSTSFSATSQKEPDSSSGKIRGIIFDIDGTLADSWNLGYQATRTVLADYHNNNNNNNNDDNNHHRQKDGDDTSHPRGIILKTPHGNIRIHFLPHLSGPSSLRYLLSTVRSSSCVQRKGCLCERCKFYRAEPNLLLQGVIADAVPRNKELGPCPPNSSPSEDESKQTHTRECPKHDPHCGCHGPIMTKGMVGWAGGGGGPDFFIDTHERPVEWWERQHTVWGEVRDEESLGVVQTFYDLPAHLTSMRMLDEEVEFYLELF
mmetsp:Transcript_27639/g.56426  ORF Transcript_27639/g.56426 Transcript_27639/m.56426 type:complete len:319 (+) Transcript_27639:120-1076(+)